MTADAILRIVFQARNEATGKIAEVREQLKSVPETIAAASQKLRNVGSVMSVSMTAPLMLVGNKAINAASDLNETVTKTEAIFKTNAGQMLAWGETAARTMGMSKRAALDYASSFAGALKNIGGVSEAEAAKSSQALTLLSADLASFNNTSSEAAAAALRSALTGEFESMKQFNVSINETILKQKALELGLAGPKGEMDAQAKQAATLAVIYEQTADAAGDFARTSDGLANAQRTLAADYENLAGKIGQQLLPIKLKLVEVISQVIKWVSELSPEMQKMGLIAAGVAAALGPVLVVVGMLWPALVALKAAALFLAGAFLPIAAVLAAVVAAGYLVFTNWDAIKAAAVALVGGVVAAFTDWKTRNAEAIGAIVGSVRELWENIKTMAAAVASIVGTLVDAVVGKLEEWLSGFGGMQGAFEGFVDFVTGAVGSLVAAVSAGFNFLTGIFLDVANVLQSQDGAWAGFKERVAGAMESVKAAVMNLVTAVVQAFTDWKTRNAEAIGAIVAAFEGIWASLQVIGSAVVSIVGALVDAVVGKLNEWLAPLGGITGAWQALLDGVTIVGSAIAGAVGALVTAVVGKLNEWLSGFGGITGAWQALLDTVTTIVAGLISLISGYFNFLATGFAAVANVLQSAGGPWEGFKELVAAAMQRVKKVVVDMVIAVVAEIKAMGGKLLQAGKDAMDGLKNGISSKFNDVKAAAGRVTGGAVDIVNKVLDNNSPSEVMRKIGVFFAQGFRLGIADGSGGVLATAGAMADDAIRAADGRVRDRGPVPAGGRRAAADVVSMTGVAYREDQDNPLVQLSSQLNGSMSLLQQSANVAQEAYQGISGSIEGLINRTMTWGQAMANVGLSITNGIVKSIADATAAWITQHVIVRGLMTVTNALGLTLQAKQTATTVAAGATQATAMAPSAMLTSISSFGSAALLGAAAVVAAMALIGSFYDGGYTGGGARNKVAGVVEHEEFVVNALGTQRNREFLEFANRGGNLNALLGTAAGAGYQAAAAAGGMPVMEASRDGAPPTVILVDSRASAERAAAAVEGPVTIQMVRDEISRFRG